MTFPKMLRIRQEFKTNPITDISSKVRSELTKIRFGDIIKPGSHVAITAGSRGIANISTVLSTVINELKNIGATPFIVPTMGSHGGATPEGQRRVLENYGITEGTMGVPIRSTMEVVQVGSTSQGLPVFLDRYAHEADQIVVINRVKPHTDFKASIESGLMKMMATGLGKQKGADLYHQGFVRYGYYPVILSVAQEILRRCPVAFGLALIENQKDETTIIRAILPDKIEENERILLRKAKRLLPRLPFNHIDILIVDWMGKEISGTGMDTNVIGRHTIPFSKFPPKPKILRIFVRDLLPHANGNATGLGNADFTTKRLVEKIDCQATYMNCITASAPEVGKIPPYFENDRQAIEAAVKTIGPVKPENIRIVHIANTLRLEEIEVSEALTDEVRNLVDVRIISDPYPMAFDEDRNLISNLLAK